MVVMHTKNTTIGSYQGFKPKKNKSQAGQIKNIIVPTMVQN